MISLEAELMQKLVVWLASFVEWPVLTCAPGVGNEALPASTTTTRELIGINATLLCSP